MVAFLHTRPARLASVVAIEIAGHALLACEVWVIVAALGAHRSIGFAFVAEGAVKFIGTVFAFVPGQLGASEGSYVVIFRSLGLADAVGLTVAVVRRPPQSARRRNLPWDRRAVEGPSGVTSAHRARSRDGATTAPRFPEILGTNRGLSIISVR